jgi:DNA-binding XRE family transcriptional regulator
MKYNISKDWCARMASNEDGGEIGAGILAVDPFFETVSSVNTATVDEPNIAFGRFISLMRRKHRLTIEALAQEADLDTLALIEIEEDTRYKPEVRTVYQLANYFDVPRPKLMQIAGLTAPKDDCLFQQAVKFAASSESVEDLTAQERAALEAFVAVLSEKK